MKPLVLIISILILCKTYSQSQKASIIYRDTVAQEVKDTSNKLSPSYIPKSTITIKVKPRFRENGEKTRAGILLKNTYLGAVGGAVIGLGLASLNPGQNDDPFGAHLGETFAVIGLGAAVGIPIGFVVGTVKAVGHKRKRVASL